MRYLAFTLALMLVCGGSRVMAIARPGDGLKFQAQGQPVQGLTSRPAIELRGNLFSVRLRNIPWETVLKEIQHQTGIMIYVQDRIAGTLTQEFEDLPLETGLRTLFRGTDLAFFYAASTTEGSAADALTHIGLFPKDSMTADEGLIHHSAAGPAAESQDEDGSAAEPHDEGGSPGEMAQTASSEEEAKLEGEPVVEDDHERRLEARHVSTQYGNEAELEQPVSPADQGIRATAFIADRDPQEAAAVLVSSLKSEEPAGRLQALDVLRQSVQTDEKIVLSVLGEALNDEDMAVKGYAIQALAERGGPGALEPLRQALHNPDPSIRIMVLASTVHSGQGRSLLEEAILDADPEVRSFAAFWLEQAVAEGR